MLKLAPHCLNRTMHRGLFSFQDRHSTPCIWAFRLLLVQVDRLWPHPMISIRYYPFLICWMRREMHSIKLHKKISNNVTHPRSRSFLFWKHNWNVSALALILNQLVFNVYRKFAAVFKLYGRIYYTNVIAMRFSTKQRKFVVMCI